MTSMKKKPVVLIMGSDIRIPSNGIITVMKMICHSEELQKTFDIQTVFFSFPTLSKLIKVFGALRAIPSFLGKIRNVQVVHIHHSTGLSFYMTMLFVFLIDKIGKNVILHNHGADFREFYAAHKVPIKSLIRRTFESATAVITLSESWRKWHSQTFGEKANWLIMQNPTPLKQPGTPNPAESKPLTVLYMSRLEQRKGVYDLVDIISEVVKEYPEITFVFAGDGDVEQVTEKVKECSLARNVKMIGWVDEEKKINALKRADIFVLPSYNEGLPMALLEAMSYGIPSIASAVGGIPELIRNNENGMIINPGDKNQLSKAILLLAGDKELRQKIGIAAYDTIKQSYALDQYLSQLSHLYMEFSDKAR